MEYIIFPKYYRVIKSRLRWAGNVACLTDRTGAYKVLVGKPEGRRSLERSRRRWKDNIKINLREWDGVMDWIYLAQDRDRWRTVVNAVINLRVS